MVQKYKIKEKATPISKNLVYYKTLLQIIMINIMGSEKEKFKLFENGGPIKGNLNFVISHLSFMTRTDQYLRLSFRTHVTLWLSSPCSEK